MRRAAQCAVLRSQAVVWGLGPEGVPVEGRAGCVLPVCFLTAVPALRCPLRAFGKPSWTSFNTRVTKHRSPGVTVSILGIRRAKLDVLHATDHPSQQSRRYGVQLGIRRAKLDVLHATDHPSQQSRRYGVHLGHSASQAGRATRH